MCVTRTARLLIEPSSCKIKAVRQEFIPMPQAVIRLAGKQYLVEPGQTITTDKLDTKPGDTIDTTEVLLVIDGDQVSVGTPVVDKAKVSLKVIDTAKGKKVRVAKYRAKSRYRRVIGHRQTQTKLEVAKISL